MVQPRYTPNALEHIAVHIVDDFGNSLDLINGVELVLSPGGTVDVPGATSTSAFMEEALLQFRAIRIGLEKLINIMDDSADVDLLDEAMNEQDSN